MTIIITDNIIPRPCSGYEVIATFKQTQRSGQEREQKTLPSIRAEREGVHVCLCELFFWINQANA